MNQNNLGGLLKYIGPCIPILEILILLICIDQKMQRPQMEIVFV